MERRAVITKVRDGLGYGTNDDKYIGPAYGRMVTIKHKFPADINDGLYLTDFFQEEHMAVKNDYIHYGFLIVSDHNLTWLSEEDIAEYNG